MTVLKIRIKAKKIIHDEHSISILREGWTLHFHNSESEHLTCLTLILALIRTVISHVGPLD